MLLAARGHPRTRLPLRGTDPQVVLWRFGLAEPHTERWRRRPSVRWKPGRSNIVVRPPASPLTSTISKSACRHDGRARLLAL
jgi:hypothetical protein